MKRIYTITLALFLSAGSVIAQEAAPSAKTMSLEECIQYALQNSISAQNATLDEEIAKARVKETTGIGLPQVVVASGLNYNPQLPRFFGRAVEPDPNNPGAFSLIPFLPGMRNGDIVSAQNFFQLQASGDANVTANQIIFNGSYFVGLQAASAYRELSYKTSSQTRETIVLNVTKAYYGVLINNERSQLFDVNLGRVDSLLRNTKALRENGFAENIDVDRIQVSYNNLIAERDKFENLKNLSLAVLKFQMNFPMTDLLSITGSIQDVQVQSAEVLADGWDFKQRPDYQVLQANRTLQALNLRNQYAGALPTIAAFGRYGYQTQSPTIGGLFKTNTPIQDQEIEGLGRIGPDKWYSYSMVGLSLNWTPFNGMQRHHKIQQEKLALQKIDNSFRQLKAGIDLEVAQSSIMFENTLKTLTTQKENMQLAENVARVTRIKFEQGVGSNLEVVTAESDLKEAQNNYYNSLYDAMLAKVDLDKAYGKLTPAASAQTK